jgi:anti-sigma regulatory factor (Ser/Thr protein kinase)
MTVVDVAGSGRAKPERAYRHEALFYAGEADFVAGTASFLREGLAQGESALVAVVPSKIRALRSALGGDADRLSFMDMAELGRNPARIIPAWVQFASEPTSPRRLRGIGEPVWLGRSPAELAESQLHEALLNLAIPATSPLWLLCPYDTAALDQSVIDDARRSHPFIQHGAVHAESTTFDGAGAVATAITASLPEPPADRFELAFGSDELSAVRRLVSTRAMDVGLDSDRTLDLLTAVNEVATNSLLHGGGSGMLRSWVEHDTLICEVSDRGHVDDPLVGRIRQSDHQLGGRGLWLVNQVCDLVQIRSTHHGTTIRLHMRCA